MKKFEDLKFLPHRSGDGLWGRMFFPNGYGVSVVRFKIPLFGEYGSYTSNENEWELAVLKGTEEESCLCYDTPVTNDVMGHLSAPEVTEIMEQVQSLPEVSNG